MRSAIFIRTVRPTHTLVGKSIAPNIEIETASILVFSKLLSIGVLMYLSLEQY